jgi:hypothetical protein
MPDWLEELVRGGTPSAEWLPPSWSPRRIVIVNRHRALGDLLFVMAVMQRMIAIWPEVSLLLVQARSAAAEVTGIAGLAAETEVVDDVGQLPPPVQRRVDEWLTGADLVWFVLVDGDADRALVQKALACSDRVALYTPGPQERFHVVRQGRCTIRAMESGITRHRCDQLQASVFDAPIDGAALPALAIDEACRGRAGDLRRRQLAAGASGVVLFVLGVGDWLPHRRVPLEIWQAAADAVRDAGLAVVADAYGFDGAPRLDGVTFLGDAGLPLLLAMTSCADLVVSGDTGPAHAAMALGIPSVTIFGPTSAAMHGHRTGDCGLDVEALPCPYGVADATSGRCASFCAPGAGACFAPAAHAATAIRRLAQERVHA